MVNSTVVAVWPSARASSAVCRRPMRWHDVVRDRSGFLFLMVRILPGIAFLVPLFVIYRHLGFINTLGGIALAHIIFVLPLVIWIMVGFFEDIPRELEESALIDGCSRIGIFMRIVLPLSKPGIVAATILGFIASWNNFIFVADPGRQEYGHSADGGLQFCILRGCELGRAYGCGDHHHAADHRTFAHRPAVPRRRTDDGRGQGIVAVRAFECHGHEKGETTGERKTESRRHRLRQDGPSSYRRILYCGRYEVAALADPDESAMGEMDARFAISTAHYRDARAMLDAEKLDVVSVCTWHTGHSPWTVAAAARRPKAILCEKPMADTLGRADEMMIACHRNGVKLAIGHQRRFLPAYTMARDLIATGRDRRVSLMLSFGGQGLPNYSSHQTDMFRYLLGDENCRWVMGNVERKTDRFERTTRIEDRAVAVSNSWAARGRLFSADVTDTVFQGAQIYGTRARSIHH